MSMIFVGTLGIVETFFFSISKTWVELDKQEIKDNHGYRIMEFGLQSD